MTLKKRDSGSFEIVNWLMQSREYMRWAHESDDKSLKLLFPGTPEDSRYMKVIAAYIGDVVSNAYSYHDEKIMKEDFDLSDYSLADDRDAFLADLKDFISDGVELEALIVSAFGLNDDEIREFAENRYGMILTYLKVLEATLIIEHTGWGDFVPTDQMEENVNGNSFGEEFEQLLGAAGDGRGTYL